MIPTAELKGDQRRLMETDNRVVLPVGKTVRLLFTASDVLHSWGGAGIWNQIGRRPWPAQRDLGPRG
jgi:hypothetical protein